MDRKINKKVKRSYTANLGDVRAFLIGQQEGISVCSFGLLLKQLLIMAVKGCFQYHLKQIHFDRNSRNHEPEQCADGFV